MGSEKIIFSEILKSSEFNQFKVHLNKIQQSIEERNISDFVDSINRLSLINQDVILKANKTQSFILKKYFRDSEQLKDAIFFQTDKKFIFEIGFEDNIPSYLNPKTKQYCSLNLNLGKIDFSNQRAELYNISNSFKNPIKIQKSYFLSQKMKIDKLNFEIEELTMSLNSRKDIAKYTYSKEKNIFNFIKILFTKDYHQEYKDILESKLNIKKEEVSILKDELNKDQEYVYEDIFFKILKSQKYLEEVLEKENFDIKYIK